MRLSSRSFCFLCALVAGAATDVLLETREQAYRENNLGVALLEQYRHQEAAESFRKALAADPTLRIARINLAIALFNLPDLSAAEREARAATEASPDAPQPRFVLGLVARAQSRSEEAKAAFQRVLALDPADVGAQVNLGQLYLQERKYDEAVAAFRSALAAEPYNATAVYNLGLALVRSGQAAEGQRMLERFQALRAGGYGTLIGQVYPEQGRYAEAIASTGAEAELVDVATPAVRFVDATPRVLRGSSAAAPAAPAPRAPAPDRPDLSAAELAGALMGRVVLADLDGDGTLDLFEVGPEGERLYRNEGGRLVDVTSASGVDPSRPGVGAVAGDYDNDGRPDIFVLRAGGSTLHRNEGGWRFSDATASAGLPAAAPLAAAFVDADHDGDLDLFLAGPPNRLLQNSGSGTFKDVTEAAGLEAIPARAVAVVPTDFDNRRDVDLLELPFGEAPKLFRNMRDGTFRDVAAETGVGPGAKYLCAAAADVNKDGLTDFFFGVADGQDLLALSDGKGRFVVSPAPLGSTGSTAALFLDYDNDGLLDLVTLSPKGARLLRNLGREWSDVSEAALPDPVRAGETAIASLAAGDVDADGDTDLVLRLSSGELRFWENQGGNRNRSLRVRLLGLVSNRSAVGAKIEMRAGSLRQKLETYAATPAPAPADVVFGLGKRAGADAVRVLWPAGVLQTEIVSSTGARVAVLEVKELDRKPSSCPYLYAWNGRRFVFVTDFMGGGEMGYWEGPGEWNHPDPDEYVRLTDEQLRPRDGRYEIRVTNELEEVLFVDRLALLAVSHPAEVEVYPNEGMLAPPLPPFRLYGARNARPPLSAVDDHGHDVLDRLARRDRRYPDDFRRHRIRGYAEEHTLTLELAPGADLLLLTAWTDYAFSSDNVAARQAGLTMRPPEIQAQDAGGSWRKVADIGIPVGRPQTVVVDLAGRWPGPGRRARIVTNMRIYWDQIRMAEPVDAKPRTQWLRPLSADLRERGFSAEVSPDGREPLGYDYQRVSLRSPWKVVPGRYTRPGDVGELLLASDDLFVISRPGDEIALAFDATALAALPRGWRRTFLVFADGFSKEMDLHSATPDALGPLPFHGMTRYPYGPPEAYPMTPERLAILERYDTRVVTSPVPPLELALSQER